MPTNKLKNITWEMGRSSYQTILNILRSMPTRQKIPTVNTNHNDAVRVQFNGGK